MANLCDLCNQRPASTRVTRILGNRRIIENLCDVCSSQRSRFGRMGLGTSLFDEFFRGFADEDFIGMPPSIRQPVERFDITRDLAEDIYDVALEEGVEPRLAFGLVKTESTFREGAVSPVGARGLTQLMPRTARWLMPGTTSQDLHDRRTNLRLGFRYLDQLIRKYRGDIKLALTAYNRGPGTVDRVLARGGDPDNGYAGKVLAP